MRSRTEQELETIRDWLRWAATRFGLAELHFGHGTDEAWDEAVALVADGLRLPRDRLDALLDARLTTAEREQLASMIDRRIDDRVPVPYLTGLAWQAGFAFEVDPRVLIPRSPIAGLLETGLAPWLGNRAPARILDLCCGSGCLGILAAHAFPEAEIVLADLSADALAVARRNVLRHGLEDRARCLCSDGLDAVDGSFDLVLCNPPYVDADDLASMPPEFGHEPALALAGGDDGLDLVDRLLDAAPAHLNPQALLVLEVGNSAPALHARRPRLPLIWPELPTGGVGVALIEGDDLRADPGR